jgi:hypothetical protein
LIESLKADGKVFEDAIKNNPAEKMDIDDERSSASSSSSSSRSNSPSSESQSPPRKSRSVSPDERPSFSGATDTFKTPALPLQREGNKGAHLLQKMGWVGGGLGTAGKVSDSLPGKLRKAV